VGGGAAVGGGTGSGGGAACDIAAILNRNCGAADCHGTATKVPTVTDLNFFTPDLEARVYNKPASYLGVENPEACPTTKELLIDPAGLESSLMWKKITETHSCGEAMPDGVTFDEMETNCYKLWLEGILANPPQ
jgi:hypothetical protein